MAVAKRHMQLITTAGAVTTTVNAVLGTSQYNGGPPQENALIGSGDADTDPATHFEGALRMTEADYNLTLAFLQDPTNGWTAGLDGGGDYDFNDLFGSTREAAITDLGLRRKPA